VSCILLLTTFVYKFQIIYWNLSYWTETWEIGINCITGEPSCTIQDISYPLKKYQYSGYGPKRKNLTKSGCAYERTSVNLNTLWSRLVTSKTYQISFSNYTISVLYGGLIVVGVRYILQGLIINYFITLQTKVYMTCQTSHVHFLMSPNWLNNSTRCHENSTSCITSEQVGIRMLTCRKRTKLSVMGVRYILQGLIINYFITLTM
jgi:hypothetical protein